MQNLDQKLIKKSSVRLIVAGTEVELTEYGRPYFYNFAPSLRSGGNTRCSALENIDDSVVEGTVAPLPPVPVRREDHLERARHRIRRLITTNASTEILPMFVTFTFAKNITSVKEANIMWAQHNRKLKKVLGYTPKYLVVIEFQKRGAIHYHCVYFNITSRTRLRALLGECWGQGIVDVKKIKKIQRLGYYVGKYLRKDIADPRLSAEKAFFCSKGLLKPQEFRNPERIALFLQCATMQEVGDVRFESERYGIIRYRQYKI